jgi:hypothetical protein
VLPVDEIGALDSTARHLRPLVGRARADRDPRCSPGIAWEPIGAQLLQDVYLGVLIDKVQDPRVRWQRGEGATPANRKTRLGSP